MQSAIGDLILLLKGDRTYDHLSRDCGGVPTAGRIQQMATRPQNAFPSPDSIRGLAKGLGVKPSVIMDACGQDFELWNSEELSSTGLALPAGSDQLTPSQHSVLVSVARELVNSNEREAQLRAKLDGSNGGASHVA